VTERCLNSTCLSCPCLK